MMTEILIGVGASVAVVIGVLWKLWRSAVTRRDEAEGYRDTRKRMDEVEGDVPRIPDDAREWLRKRGK